MLFNAGVQMPVKLFDEVVGNAAKTPPEQIAGTWVKVGTIFGFTTIIIVVIVAH